MKAVSILVANSKNSSHKEGNEITEKSDRFTFEKVNNTIYKIVYDQIRYIESDRDNVKLFMENKKYSFRQSLKYWEEILPEHEFSRVHKSYILNVSKITQITGNRIIAGNDVIPIGRNYKDSFMEKINKNS
ncbi:MAG: LytTR family DNA-binding domain-containing protein [Balneolales bacterium]